MKKEDKERSEVFVQGFEAGVKFTCDMFNKVIMEQLTELLKTYDKLK
jgi:hypothetical protein